MNTKAIKANGVLTYMVRNDKERKEADKILASLSRPKIPKDWGYPIQVYIDVYRMRSGNA